MPENRITIDIETRAGARLGAGPISTATEARWSWRLDRAGEFQFTMPALAGLPDALIMKRVVRMYVDGVQTFIGIIERVSRAVDVSGAMLTIEGTDLLGELAENSIGFLALNDGDDGGITDGPARVLAAVTQWAWELDGEANTDTATYVQFAGESALAALQKVAANIGEHFYLYPQPAFPFFMDRVIYWLGVATPDSGIRLIAAAGDQYAVEQNTEVALIQSLTEEADGAGIVNRIYAYASGTGAARLSLARAETWCDPPLVAPIGYENHFPDNYVDSLVSQGMGFPIISQHVQFPEITLASGSPTDVDSALRYLYTAAIQWLARCHIQQVAYRVTTSELPAAVRPGSTVRVIYADEKYTINANMTVIEIVHRIDQNGVWTSEPLISSAAAWPQSDAEILATEIEQTRSMAARSQATAASAITGTISTDQFSAYADLVAESKIGAASTQVAAGDHGHAGGDITSGTISTDRYSAYADLTAETKIGASSTQVAAGDHGHAAVAIPFCMGWSVPGTLVTGAVAVRLHAPRAGAISNVTATVGTAPTGASLIVDIHKAGTTIFTTQGNRPTITAGNQDDLSSAPDVAAFSADDLFTLEIDQIGSTVAGADLMIQMRCTA